MFVLYEMAYLHQVGKEENFMTPFCLEKEFKKIVLNEAQYALYEIFVIFNQVLKFIDCVQPDLQIFASLKFEKLNLHHL